MELLSFLEKLASTTHSYTETEKFYTLPHKVQEAFINNNGSYLKDQLGDTSRLANRDKVVSLNY